MDLLRRTLKLSDGGLLHLQPVVAFAIGPSGSGETVDPLVVLGIGRVKRTGGLWVAAIGLALCRWTALADV